MASAPVESFKTGGLFCFTDLTVCDPYYVLPILTSATLFLSIEVGRSFLSNFDSEISDFYLFQLIPSFLYFE